MLLYANIHYNSIVNFPLILGERFKVYKLYCVFLYYSFHGNKQFLPLFILASCSTHIQVPNGIKIAKFYSLDLTYFSLDPTYAIKITTKNNNNSFLKHIRYRLPT